MSDKGEILSFLRAWHANAMMASDAQLRQGNVDQAYIQLGQQIAADAIRQSVEQYFDEGDFGEWKAEEIDAFEEVTRAMEEVPREEPSTQGVH